MELFLLRCLLLTLLSCSTLVFSAVPVNGGGPVLDTDGHPVVAGFPYYVRAAQAKNDGNLGWVSLNGSCPLNVLLKPFPYGPPVMFFPEESRQNKTVLLAEKLSVMFAAPPPYSCDKSTLWKLDRSVGFVTTGGVAAAAAASESSQSRFRIVRYPFPGENVYHFMYCPDERLLCITVGLGYRSQTLLGESTEPMALKFIKVADAS